FAGRDRTHHALDSHDVAADAPLRKEPTGALPLAVLEAHEGAIVIPAERCREALDAHAFRLLGVDVCLLDLSDETGVHCYLRRLVGPTKNDTPHISELALSFR